MEQANEQKLQEMGEKLDRIEKSVESTRTYLMWTFIVSAVVLVLPILGLMYAIPAMLSTYNDIGNF